MTSITLVFQKPDAWPRRCSHGITTDCAGGTVSFRNGAVVALATAVAIIVGGEAVRIQGQNQNQTSAQTQDSQSEIVRRAKTKVWPVYPDLARKMNLAGTVKVAVIVAPNGTVKEAKVVGGHPVLAGAALDAVKKWKFEPASVETSGVVDFKFDAH
jgi:TonB family protein